MHKHTLLTVVATLLFDMFELLVANLVWQEEQRKTEHVTVELCLYKLEVLKTSDLPEQMLSVYYTGWCQQPSVLDLLHPQKISIQLVKLCYFEDK